VSFVLVAERYRLGEPLGRGGMGEVFRGVDEVLGRPVAVKLLGPSDRDPAAAERFRREARAAAILNDTHVVAVYDFGKHGDRSYLVMELVEGRSIAEELAQTGRLPRDRAVDIIEQTAAGLAAAHKRDIVHRDIKPGNLLLATDGTVKIADFGIAHLPDEEANTLTATGQIIGSTHYLAPERAQGRPADKASDIYSLGCVLYQLVAGRPPFTAEHPTAILYQHVDADPPRPSQLHPELGGAFEALLLRMLAKDPAARPTAPEIAAGALRTAANSTPTLATGAATGLAAGGVAGVAAGAVAGATAPDSFPPTLTDQAVAAPAGQPGEGTGLAAAAAVEGASSASGNPVAPEMNKPAGVLAEWSGTGRRKRVLVGAAALMATAAAVAAGVLMNGNETQPPATTNLEPRPGIAPATPGRTPTPTAGQPSSNRTESGAVNPADQSTPLRSPSQQGTPTPGTTPSSTPSTGTSSPSPQASSTPTQSSSTPSATTSASPSTTTTPPPDPSPSSKPSTSGTPPADPVTPAANGAGSISD